MTTVTFEDITVAAERIRGRVHRTPVLTSSTFDAELGFRIFFKCENLQKIGAFKARGAMNAVLALDDDAANRGVIAHSSGNHGAALAYAASQRGVPCVVVMPETAPGIKVQAVRGYGAEVVFCKRGEREATTDALIAERGMTLVHPFENEFVIAGQGTASLELIEDVGELDALIVPVGGGGLCAGTALTAAARLPNARVFAAEPIAVDDAARSMQTGVRQPTVPNPDTICDGLLTGLGEPNFDIMRAHGVEVFTVDEDSVRRAARDFLERMKIVVEPSCATVLAALRDNAARFSGQRVGAVISGGNTDFGWL